MPPKKSSKKKSDTKDDDSDPTIAYVDDRIKYLEYQTKALEMQLAHKSELTSDATAKVEIIREELNTITSKFEEEKQTTMDVTRTMTRQYKGMQEELLNKINERERLIATLKDELEMQKMVHAELIAAKDRVIEQKDEAAAKSRQEMDDTFKHFSNLLLDARLKICHHIKGGGQHEI